MASLFTSLTHSLTHFHSQPAASRAGFRALGGRRREAMASGGDGFGTERARLVGDALGTERARLAQGGFRGKFYKRNPFKRIF